MVSFVTHFSVSVLVNGNLNRSKIGFNSSETWFFFHSCFLPFFSFLSSPLLFSLSSFSLSSSLSFFLSSFLPSSFLPSSFLPSSFLQLKLSTGCRYPIKQLKFPQAPHSTNVNACLFLRMHVILLNMHIFLSQVMEEARQ